MEREAAKKQEELFAMEKLNDALNEKLKSLSMEVCTVTLPINEFEGTIDSRTLCTRALSAVFNRGPKDSVKVGRGELM